MTDGAFPAVRFPAAAAPEAVEGCPSPDHLIRQLGIVGDHPEMRKALATAALLAPASVPVLVLGETGTGKEVFSRFVHLLSGRPREAFFPVNCAALPHELVESILFGHKKGAFSGAVADQKGKFEAADGGTLFLDEIGELPAAAQAKLLRVLQDGVVEPLGATKPKKVDVRLVAATNRDLAKEVREGRFREDLYYRVNCGVVQLPPLRSRRTDIPKLALGILDQVNRSLKRPKRLSAEALSKLQMQDWPGNVRDLRNVLERSALLSKGDVLDVGDLQIAEPVRSADPYAGLPEPAEGFSLDGFLSGARRHIFEQALAMADGNQSRAGKLLGVSSQAVHKFLQERKR
jgi:two-component system response regulator HydG